MTGATPARRHAERRASRRSVSDELLDALPSEHQDAGARSSRSRPGMAARDGRRRRAAAIRSLGASFHGKQRHEGQFDGMCDRCTAAGTAIGLRHPNSALVEETAVETSGISAESNAGGAVVNMIPKEGGNTLSGSAVRAVDRRTAFRGDNLTDDLRDARPDDDQQGPAKSTTPASRSAGRSSGTGSGSSRRRASGAIATSGGHVLEQDPGHAVLDARPEPAGRPLPVVRVEGAAGHVAGVAAEQDQLVRRLSRTRASVGRSGAVGQPPEAGNAFHFRPIASAIRSRGARR